MIDCDVTGCKYLKTTCAICGRVVDEKALPKPQEWISVKDRLPDIKNICWYSDVLFFLYDGKDVFYGHWGKIDCDHEKKYEKTNGLWFGDIDGTECFDAFDGITHWMEAEAPEPPK